MDREGTRRIEKSVMPDPGVVTMNVTPPGGRMFWLEKSMLPEGRLGQIKPTFKVGEVAKIFFARSPDWLRWLGTQHDQHGGIFVLNGQPLEIKRTSSGARTYTLVDVEHVAHALLENHKIDVQQYVAAINMVRWMAYSYKILSAEDMIPHESQGLDPQGEQLTLPGIDEQIAEVVAAQEMQREFG